MKALPLLPKDKAQKFSTRQRFKREYRCFSDLSSFVPIEGKETANPLTSIGICTGRTLISLETAQGKL